MIGIMAALANKDVMSVLADKLFITKIMEVFKTAAALRIGASGVNHAGNNQRGTRFEGGQLDGENARNAGRS